MISPSARGSESGSMWVVTSRPGSASRATGASRSGEVCACGVWLRSIRGDVRFSYWTHSWIGISARWAWRIRFSQGLPDHSPDAFRSVDVPGPAVAHDPAADDEMAEIDIAVGMQMGDEQVVDLVRHQPQFGHPLNDARAAIDRKVDGARPERVARPAPPGIGERQSGAQEADLHLRLRRERLSARYRKSRSMATSGASAGGMG